MHSAIIAAAAAKETTFTGTWSLVFSHSSIVPKLHPTGVFAHSLLDECDSYCGIVHIVQTSFLRLCEAVAEKSFHLYRYIKSEKLSPKMQIFLNFFNFFNNVALGNGLPLDGGTLYLQSIRILTNAKQYGILICK